MQCLHLQRFITIIKNKVMSNRKNTTPKYTKNNKNEKNIRHKEPELIRLNKYISNAGVCSRREADTLIKKGLIKVNGTVVTEMGKKISPFDKVLHNGKLIKPEKYIYILINKPKNTITTTKDEQGRRTVTELLGNNVTQRVYPVGRLDRDTTGVLLLTNDGELTGELTHPKYNKKKVYHVFVDKNVTKEDMYKLTQGIELEDGNMAFDAISYVNSKNKLELGVEIHSGKNRIIRRMFEALGYQVVRLDRVYFAGLTKKGLGRGKWRYLSEKEVGILKMKSYK